MEIVDLRDSKRTTCSAYLSIEQPMYVYHSEEELDTNETGNGKPPLIKIRSLDQYNYRLRELGIYDRRDYHDLGALNIWIKTIDNFLPDYTDVTSTIYYKHDANGDKIPIESGWVRLYRIYQFVYKHLLYTSSGIWNVSINDWNISAAVKTQFSALSRMPRTAEGYKKRLEKIMAKSRPGINEIRAVHSMLNPLSESFFDAEKAIRKAYKNTVRKEDRKKILTSNIFRRAIMKEISVLFPELTIAIQKTIPADDMAKFLKQVVEKAIKNETSEEAMARIKEVTDMAYTQKSFQSGPVMNQTLISEGESQTQSLPPASTPNTEVDIDKERERQNYPSSYVMDESLAEDIETIIPGDE